MMGWFGWVCITFIASFGLARVLDVWERSLRLRELQVSRTLRELEYMRSAGPHSVAEPADRDR